MEGYAGYRKHIPVARHFNFKENIAAMTQMSDEIAMETLYSAPRLSHNAPPEFQCSAAINSATVAGTNGLAYTNFPLAV